MDIIQKGRTNDGTEFKQGDIIKIETEEQGQHYSYIGAFRCFGKTFWRQRPEIILNITDNADADVSKMRIKFNEITRITKYQEERNERRGPNTRP